MKDPVKTLLKKFLKLGYEGAVQPFATEKAYNRMISMHRKFFSNVYPHLAIYKVMAKNHVWNLTGYPGPNKAALTTFKNKKRFIAYPFTINKKEFMNVSEALLRFLLHSSKFDRFQQSPMNRQYKVGELDPVMATAITYLSVKLLRPDIVVGIVNIRFSVVLSNSRYYRASAVIDYCRMHIRDLLYDEFPEWKSAKLLGARRDPAFPFLQKFKTY